MNGINDCDTAKAACTQMEATLFFCVFSDFGRIKRPDSFEFAVLGGSTAKIRFCDVLHFLSFS